MGAKEPTPAPNRKPDGTIDKSYVKPSPSPPPPPHRQCGSEQLPTGLAENPWDGVVDEAASGKPDLIDRVEALEAKVAELMEDLRGRETMSMERNERM